MISRRRFLVGATLGAATAGVAGTAIVASSDGDGADADGAADGGADGGDRESSPERSAAVSTAVVERRTLSESKELAAQINYGVTYELPLQRSGTVTSVVAAGEVIGFGDEIVRVDLLPTFLAEGNLPMFRELKKVPDQRVDGQKYMVGFDVAQLQTFLIDAGFDEDGELSEPDLVFGPVTERAVKAWQKHHGFRQTGRVDSAQVVFSPTPVRVASVPRVGAQFSTIQVTDPAQRITMPVQNRDRSLVTVGSDVEISTPDGTTVSGSIDKIERTVSDDGQAVNTATMIPDDPLPADATAASVVVARVLAEQALAVPIRALLAVQEGGFALEMATLRSDGTRDLRRVEVGEVADGWASISGDVAEGDRVVVAQ